MTKITIILKQQGNFGHAGRPGLVGGSRTNTGVSSGTSNRDYQRARDARLREENAAYLAGLRARLGSDSYKRINSVWKSATSGSQLVGNFIKNTFEYTDPETGMYSKVTEINEQFGTIRIAGTIKSKDGWSVGSFVRTIQIDGEVHHDYFSLNDNVQGTGFGSNYYRHLEESYIKAKLQRITIFADINVGGYAWARMGFDFQSNYEREAFQTRFTRKWKAEYGDDYDVPKIDHAWEMAAAIGPAGDKFGKEFMLGTNWNAIKRLNPNDTGFQVGRLYYQAKDKKGKGK